MKKNEEIMKIDEEVIGMDTTDVQDLEDISVTDENDTDLIDTLSDEDFEENTNNVGNVAKIVAIGGGLVTLGIIGGKALVKKIKGKKESKEEDIEEPKTEKLPKTKQKVIRGEKIPLISRITGYTYVKPEEVLENTEE